jgi:hypothetical protein
VLATEKGDIMTGYTVHTGSTEKFAAGWDEIFKSGKKKPTVGGTKHAAKKSPAAASRAKSRKRRKAK